MSNESLERDDDLRAALRADLGGTVYAGGLDSAVLTKAASRRRARRAGATVAVATVVATGGIALALSGAGNPARDESPVASQESSSGISTPTTTSTGAVATLPSPSTSPSDPTNPSAPTSPSAPTTPTQTVSSTPSSPTDEPSTPADVVAALPVKDFTLTPGFTQFDSMSPSAFRNSSGDLITLPEDYWGYRAVSAGRLSVIAAHSPWFTGGGADADVRVAAYQDDKEQWAIDGEYGSLALAPDLGTLALDRSDEYGTRKHAIVFADPQTGRITATNADLGDIPGAALRGYELVDVHVAAFGGGGVLVTLEYVGEAPDYLPAMGLAVVTPREASLVFAPRAEAEITVNNWGTQFAVSTPGKTELYEVGSDKPLRTLPLQERGLEFGPDSTWGITGQEVVDLTTGETIIDLPEDGFHVLGDQLVGGEVSAGDDVADWLYVVCDVTAKKCYRSTTPVDGGVSELTIGE